MSRNFEGHLSAQGFFFAIVVSRFNEFITTRLLEGAVDALTRHGADPDKIDVVKVPVGLSLAVVATLIMGSIVASLHATPAVGVAPRVPLAESANP